MKRVITSLIVLLFTVLAYGQDYTVLTTAQQPKKMVISPTGNLYYIETKSDGYNKITELNPATGIKNTIVGETESLIMNTLATGTAGTVYYTAYDSSTTSHAIYKYPTNIKVASGFSQITSMTTADNGDIYLVEKSYVIKKISGGVVSSISLNISIRTDIHDIAFAYGTLYYSRTLHPGGSEIRRIVTTNSVPILAGTGYFANTNIPIDGQPAVNAPIGNAKIAWGTDSLFLTSAFYDGNYLFKIDNYGHGNIWKVSNKIPDSALVGGTYSLAVGGAGKVYISDYNNGKILEVTPIDPMAPPPPPPSYSITGNTGVAGANVELWQTGTLIASTVSDSSGNYLLTGIINGSYSVFPLKRGYIFTPPSNSVTISGANQTKNFTVVSVPTTYAISGQVLLGSTPLPGVNVNIAYDNTSIDIATDSSGNFSYNALVTARYTLTFSKAGYAFSPTNATVVTTSQPAPISVIATDLSTAVHSITGNVGISNVNMGLYQGLTLVQSVVSDSSGSYSLTNVANGSYTLSPVKENYSFSPAIGNITIAGISQTQDFTASYILTTHDITGTVKDIVSGAGIENVSVNIYDITDGNIIERTTDSMGSFIYAAPASKNYYVTFSKIGYTLAPENIYIMGLNSPQNINVLAEVLPDTSLSLEILSNSSGKGYVKCSSEPLKIRIKNAMAGNIGMKIFTGRQARLVKEQSINNPINGDVTLEWDCTTNNGGKADSGVYLAIINGGGISNKKLKVGVAR